MSGEWVCVGANFQDQMPPRHAGLSAMRGLLVIR